MEVVIDDKSGFCFGVERAIAIAEEVLAKDNHLYCLGQIVHNRKEIERLEKKGLHIITHTHFYTLKNCKVLIRAHGEPPETYDYARRNNITLIEATCPVVLKLQGRIRKANKQAAKENEQIVIFGKREHAEVIGLAGQTEYCAILIQDETELNNIDYSKPIHLFSQTTRSTGTYKKIMDEIKSKLVKEGRQEQDLKAMNSICGQVSNRAKQLEEFCTGHDVILFVSGKNSSNGKALFEICKTNNARSYFIEDENELKISWLRNVNKVGICGATSTPKWLMQKVADTVKSLNL